jgi:hypothetical protein
LPAHIDVAAHEDVLGVLGVQRLDLCVRGLGEIKDVVALQGLVEEGQAQGENNQRDDDELAAQEIKNSRARAGSVLARVAKGRQLLIVSTARKRALPLIIRS